MKVLLTKRLFEADRAYLDARADPAIEWLEPPSWDEQGVLARIDEAEVLFGGLLSESILARGAHLRFLQLPWTGADALDLAMLARHDVVLCNSHSNAACVAEHALGLMLALARKIPYHDRLLRQGHWNRPGAAGTDGSGDVAESPFSASLSGSRVALIGLGAIGTGIARLLRGFDCSLQAITASGTLREPGPVPAERVHPASRLLPVLAESDRVFVSVPATAATVGLFDRAAFEALGEHGLLVNVARGSVLDEAALHEALVSRRIAGAALDTWYRYPSAAEPRVHPSARFAFHDRDNLVLSPHRAGFAEGCLPHLDDAVQNLNRAVAGQAPLHVVDPQRGY